MNDSSSSLSMSVIDDFLAQKRIAMVGISRQPGSFSVNLFEELCRRGYDVVPVNPKLKEVSGRHCFAHVQDIEPPVEAALLMTSSEVTEEVVHDCAEAGIRRVWMYRAAGKGAVNAKGLQFCREHAIQVVPGECPYMFLPGGGAIHRLHGVFRKLTGKYPKYH
jgi:predicted CoA-binding protein